MDWGEKIFRYCERGSDPGFWAEPLNAVSNAAFLIAALLAAYAFWRLPKEERNLTEAVLIALVAVIGIGSFLFHTLATQWTSQADVIPIGVFMLVYLAYALRRFLGLPWLVVAGGLALFVLVMQGVGDLQCGASLAMTGAARGPCLNGSLGYVPALAAMLGIGALLAVQRHPAWAYVLAAGIVFLFSLTFRSLDWQACALTRIGGHPIGTHFLWHILNATTLYLLLKGALRTPRRASLVH
jgi:hypothetical protein